MYVISFFLILLFFYFPARWEELIFSRISHHFSIVMLYIRSLDKARNGRELSLVVSQMKSDFKLGRPFVQRTFPEYKFYDRLVEEISYYFRKFGINPEESLSSIHGALLEDYKFEKRLQKNYYGGWIQFSFLSLIVWSFIYMTNKHLEIDLTWTTRMIILNLHLMGWISYVLLYNMIKKYLFRSYANYFQSLYILQILSEVEIPIKLSIERSNIQILIDKKWKQFERYNRDIGSIIYRWRTQGQAPSRDIHIILDLLWFEMEEGYLTFHKINEIMKFFITTFFYLSSYFLFVLSLFDYMFTVHK